MRTSLGKRRDSPSQQRADGTVVPSFCRVCHNFCAILVTVKDGIPVAVTGDRDNPYFRGFSCTKGREQAQMYRHPGRLLHPLKRMADGRFARLPAAEAVGEIGERLASTIDRYGPRAVAMYLGTMSSITSVPAGPMGHGFMNAIESPMQFRTTTIDQPGKFIAPSFHGEWMAPAQKFDSPDVMLCIGINPLVTFIGFAAGNPSVFLQDLLSRQGELIVIDPRYTDVARRATLYLQPRPGEDVAIVAGMLHVILREELYDKEFVATEVDGIEALRRHVTAFTPEYVAERADIDAESLIDAARRFGRARRGQAVAGTGPSMSGNTTLLEYLILCLDTICGHWMRAGELVKAAPTLWKTRPRAQANPPTHSAGLGASMRSRDLIGTGAGMPTAAIADEILMDRPDRVRVLLSSGGNPVVAWPDQLRTVAAFRQLDLLVQLDVQMSQTARMADYVIAVKGALEMPSLTSSADACIGIPGMGMALSHSQYTPAVADPPEGSELLEDWEFFYKLGQAMGLQLELTGTSTVPFVDTPLDMTTPPTHDDFFELLTKDARVQLNEVKAHPHGALYPDPPVTVAPKEDGWAGRLHVGSEPMMRDLDAFYSSKLADSEFPFRLLSRRTVGVYNSAINQPGRKRHFNPAFFNPEDLAGLDIACGDSVVIESERAAIHAVAQPEKGLRRGTISMSHGFGDGPDEPGTFAEIGSSTSRLVDNSGPYEKYSGQPRMSNIPVRVRRVDSAEAEPGSESAARAPG